MNKLKIFIRVVSSLMLVSFVFGIFAFVKANKNGELKALYKDEQTVKKEDNTETNAANFRQEEKHLIIPVDSLDNATLSRSTAIEKPDLNVTVKKKNTRNRKKYHSKRPEKFVSIESFSRGSLEMVPIKKTIELEK